LVVLLVSLVCIVGHVSGQNLADPNFQASQFSIATTLYNSFYGGGACGENPSGSETDLMAMPWPNSQYDFAFCGACYLVTGPSGSSTVKIFDWGPGSGTIYQQRWVLNGYNGGPYPSIGCTGGNCNVKMQLVTCPVTGDIILDFNQYNNGYYILVYPRNKFTAVYKMTHNDSTTGVGKVNAMDHSSQTNYVLANYHVLVPFTLTMYSITGEVVSYTVTGLGSVGYWPSGDLGSTVSVTTNVQFSKTYTGYSTSNPTNGGSGSGGSNSASSLRSPAAYLLETIL